MAKKIFPLWFGIMIVEALALAIIPLPTYSLDPLIIFIYCLLLVGYTVVIIHATTSRADPLKYLFAACALLQLGLYIAICRLLFSGIDDIEIIRAIGMIILAYVGAMVAGLIGFAAWVGLLVLAVKLMPKLTIKRDITSIHRVMCFIFFILLAVMPLALFVRYVYDGLELGYSFRNSAIFVTGFVLCFLPLEVLRIATVKAAIKNPAS